jgi:negative regulator of sigma-B (phosphoserine phosphatase)
VTDTVEWGVAVRAKPGQSESGDLAVVESFPEGLLIAAIDGLGHGPEALRAANKAAEVLRDSPGSPLPMLVRRCHEELARSRGVVMSVASLHPSERRATWLGIGNVEGRLLRRGQSPQTLLLLGGILGHQLPRLHISTLSLEPADLLVFATDGVRSYFDPEPYQQSPVQKIADRVLAEFRNENDDSLVLVARYTGGV